MVAHKRSGTMAVNGHAERINIVIPFNYLRFLLLAKTTLISTTQLMLHSSEQYPT